MKIAIDQPRDRRIRRHFLARQDALLSSGSIHSIHSLCAGCALAHVLYRAHPPSLLLSL